jgi:transcriptional regulator with PAS, ATPase and Fis domain
MWQALFLDRRLPDLDAEELSQTVRQRFPGIEVVLLDRDAEAESSLVDDEQNRFPKPYDAGVLASRAGSDDLPRPRSAPTAAAPILAGAEVLSRDPSTIAAPLPGMIGKSSVMQPVYARARLLAPRTTTVLITGPTGCGKEVVARAIHQLSPRAARTFAVVNCAAIPETLLEAELFGYARGAFTGAMQSYAGRIQAAQGGTLFLDEVGEMPLSLQPKLLRFLEQKELQRLGSAEVVRVDARVVSATNAHLLSLVREGKFREDLYYRLCGFPIEIPPLRDRCEDIPQLAIHFLEKYAGSQPAPQLSFSALQLLKAHSWPGNIRELQNVMERALILSEQQPMIHTEHLLLADSGLRTGH